MMSHHWPWLTLALLGAYHGLNPGMGWLFAVALGLQERSRSAVIRAFAPIALGHAASIAVVVALVGALQTVVSPSLLRYAGAGLLVAYGLYKLLAPMSHPRWVGMRVGFRDLTAWSFLMATAHGAGLMLVPVLFKLPTPPLPATPPVAATATAPQFTAASLVPTPSADAAAGETPSSMPACHAAVAAASTGGSSAGGRRAPVVEAAAAVALHTAAMFGVMALVALAVYEKLGLAVLRRAWFNLDLLWAVALIGAGVLTLLT
jgi:hypothetical protein